MKTWTERIAEAEKLGRFSDESQSMAQSWDTCAVGESLGPVASYPALGLEEHIYGGPAGVGAEPVRFLGFAFWRAVISNEPEEAARLLRLIQPEAQKLGGPGGLR